MGRALPAGESYSSDRELLLLSFICVCVYVCACTCVCPHVCAHMSVCVCVCVCEVFSCLHYSLARTFFVFIFSVWSLLSFWFVYSLTINSYTWGLYVFCFVLCHLFFLSFSRWCTGQLKRLCVIDRLLNPSY